MQMILIALPLVIINLIFVIIALVDLSKRKNVLWGNKIIWVVLIIFLQYIGWILYFLIGKKEE
ncbi:MAG: PLDc N-terminal domain-containing protein [Candidatus Aminicenantes bacterium]|nr:MAG: PLDc N-terminal domain-containing protein [Candidatus Aminicenantes bacterium]